MSEEQRKAVRIISIIALVAGIAVFLCGLIPPTLLILFRGQVVGPGSFSEILHDAGRYSLLLLEFIIIPAFVLSLVTLLFERNKYYQWLPFAFVVAGILLCLSPYLFHYIYFKFYWPPDPGPPPPPLQL